MNSLILVVLFFRFCSCDPGQNTRRSDPRTNTPLGTIEGSFQISSDGRLIEAYEGIAYALPPIGDLRFEIPKPISSPWPDVLMAKAPGSRCLQYNTESKITVQKLSGSENCLFLNVYKPSTSTQNPLPVLVFFHGSNFIAGAGSDYKPNHLLDRDLILVTINYRLGALGFLSTEDHIVPGNMGLKDQVIALRWVKDNIASFGGDPSRITIIGHGAGGISVQFFYFTNKTAGLFSRGMSISGTVLQPQALVQKPLLKTKKVASLVGCPTSNIRSMVDCLKAQPADKIALTLKDFELLPGVSSTAFGPVQEKGPGDFKMIDRPPMESLAAGYVQNLPWYLFSVEEEGQITSSGLINNPIQLYLLDTNFEKIAPSLLHYDDTVQEMNESPRTRRVREYYLQRRPINLISVEKVTEMMTDWLYRIGNEKAARMHARAIRSPVYCYFFTYKSSTINYGVSHYNDLVYLFPTSFTLKTQQDLKMQKKMINFWASYVTNGTANMGVEWSSLNPCQTEFRYLEIAGPEQIYMNGSTNFGNKEFWKTIDFQENILPYVS
ncbi:venom carboxylesterase-6-like [Diprion similis]|uniref:venom carboxylesterase-6-like n=1 Tax=Diprion similis TaxID=362088 RepID=UPI001EF97665|nr:venom carboxylesterase-6-like [Diprion similis]